MPRYAPCLNDESRGNRLSHLSFLMNTTHPPHAVSRLRTARLARSTRPFLARGGPHGERCGGCRLILSHCICALRPVVPTRAGVCLIMAEHEALKPSNTGWLIADVVPDTMAFGWARTEVDPALLAVLADPQWQPYVVFPGEFVAPERVITQLLPEQERCGFQRTRSRNHKETAAVHFARCDLAGSTQDIQKSPYLEQFPVLSLLPEQLSRYRLRRSRRDEHLCTSEVAGLCLQLAGDVFAAQTLEAYLDVFSEHYLRAKQQLKVDWEDEFHQRLRALAATSTPQA
jgi:DTW domain-containing protein YfiP